MKRIVLFLIACVGAICSYAQVATTDISDWKHAVYFEPASLQAGTTCDLYIRLRSEMISTGMQADILLPEGVTVKEVSAYTITDLVCSGAYQADGYYRMLYGAFAGLVHYFPKNFDDELLKLTLNIADDVEEGEYPVYIKGAVIASETGVAGTLKYPAPNVCKIRITKDPVYDEGFAVTPKAMCVKAGLEHDDAEPDLSTWLMVPVANAVDASKVTFTVTMPDGVSVGTYVFRKNEYPDVYYAGDSDDAPDVTDNEDGTYAFIGEEPMAAGNRDYIKIPLVTEATLADGIHEVTFSDIRFTTQREGYEERIYTAAPFTASLVVTSDKTTMLDLTAAKGVENLAVDATANPNMLIKAKAGQVTNEKNVIVDGVCEQLVITDGYPFGNDADFMASSASYQRTMANQWGTLCLPFPISSGEDVQYYQLAEVDAESENGKMTFTAIDDVPAHQPVVFRQEGTGITPTATNVTVETAPATLTHSSVADWSLIGCYQQTTVEATAYPNSFYIKSNQFLKVNGYFVTDPFRAYFNTTSEQASRALVFDIDFGTVTGIEGIEGTAADPVMYDLNGRRVNSATPAPGIYIVNNKKTIIR